MRTIRYSREQRETIRQEYRPQAISSYLLPIEELDNMDSYDNAVVVPQIDIADGVAMINGMICEKEGAELLMSGIAMGVDIACTTYESILNHNAWALKYTGLRHIPFVPIATVLGVIFDEAHNDTRNLRWHELAGRLSSERIYALQGGEELSRRIGASALAILDARPGLLEFTDERHTVVEAAILASDFILEQLGMIAYANRPTSGNYK